MNTYTLSSMLVTTALSSITAFALAHQNQGYDLETDLTQSYEKFRQAVIAKDHAQMKAAMSASAYMIMKNQGIAYKMDFPKDFFDGMPGKLHAGLEISKLKTLRALEKNNTGTLVVLAAKSAKFDPFGIGSDPEHTLLILTFIKEDGSWRYDALAMEGISDAEESKLMQGDLSKLNEDKFIPSGVVPATPAEEAAPDYDYDGILNINSFGYEVEVILNGKALRKTQGNSAQRTGLKKGDNTIVIKSVALDGAYDFKVTISGSKEGHAPVEVFNLVVEKPESVITKTFFVDFE